MTRILSGQPVNEAVLGRVSDAVSRLRERNSRLPGLAVVLVGDNPASHAYVASKKKACERVGFRSFDYRVEAKISESELLDLVRRLNADLAVDGILVQLPLPKGIRESVIIEAIHPDKDVDGFHPVNVGRLLTGLPGFWPCTPHGVLALLDHYGIATAQKHVVIIGRSNIVGKPMAALLIQPGRDATVTVTHSKTPDLHRFTRQADILIAAVGRPEMVTAEMVKPDAVVIDVGINRVPDPSTPKGYRIVGDVATDAVSKVASAMTPVPGGIGPTTIAMLMHNTLLSYQRREGETL
ncbi:MAG: bifunctional methylenetetrahydrofolate dehydrogenase/methenyltetrahydrofolate cyclohydrolase FolD [Candidatus Margulisiibacteriota bacterium]